MGYTRRQFVTEAFGEIGLASYVFDLEPEQLESAGRRLDAMMADWNGRGIRLGYPLPGSPELNDLDTETLVPDAAFEAIICGLAVRIAPGLGKTPSPDTKGRARSGFNMLIGKAAVPAPMQMPVMPAGAGHKGRHELPFLSPPVDRLDAGPDSLLEF